MFIKYQHLEKFGREEVANIELGECYVFPKLDGTNASVWLGDDGEIRCASRRRELTADGKDNAGFRTWAVQQQELLDYLRENPTHRLYGEWLVPHSLKTYREDAWRKFYIFDVAVSDAEGHLKYIPYHAYKPMLEAHNLEYVAPLAIVRNGSYEQLVGLLSKNTYLVEDGKGTGEGVVVKNYDFWNRFGRQTWAKIVTSEFREKHAKTMGSPEIQGKTMPENIVVDNYVTKALCEKVLAKIKVENEGKFPMKQVPRLLSSVYYDLIQEDMWTILKKLKNPTINFGKLQHLVYAKVKENLPEIFDLPDPAVPTEG